MSTTATRISAAQYYAEAIPGDHKRMVEGEIVVNDIAAKKRIYEAAGLPESCGSSTGLPRRCSSTAASAADSATFDVALELRRSEQLGSARASRLRLTLDSLFER